MMRDAVVKEYGKVTPDYTFALENAKIRAEEMVPVRADGLRQAGVIMAREAEESERRLKREEGEINEDEFEVDTVVKEQEEELLAKNLDKQTLAKEIARAEATLKAEQAKLLREKLTVQAEFNMLRAEDERRAHERVDHARFAQISEAEDMRRAFTEWKYAREQVIYHPTPPP